ncbi:MAG TPA: aminotransferase class V-fold PLP-dependent enzyme [Gemmatimonadaceae bacterium]|nr:aminotransferase class V-fold PLP-dependent enzyme [Gemmatimonadaceae bacterium]
MESLIAPFFSRTGDESMNVRQTRAEIDITPDKFRRMGHKLVDDVAAFLDRIGEQPVAPGKLPSEVRALLGERDIPEKGSDPAAILADATELLFANSTFNGHPRFFGYITASATPIGILSELLAAAVNPNVGAWQLSPAATEIELATVRWMAQLTGFPEDCGGIFVSGGNMANMVCFLAAKSKVIRESGDASRYGLLRCYASSETHTWIEKAVDIAGLGPGSIRHLAIDANGKVSASELRAMIEADKREGLIPFLVIATAGTTNTGATDPIAGIADLCREHGVWLHVDGAYGAPVAALPGASPDLLAIGRADSVAIDPHKWLYAPLEAGCALVRDRTDLERTFSHHPHYYHFDDVEGEKGTNFYELGPQNSRGFRALKVWLAMKQVGRAGYVKMIGEDIALAEEMFRLVKDTPALEPFTCDLSIVTFRYVPEDLRPVAAESMEYLNKLNEELISALQNEGEVFLSNATIDGRFLLRACIVNFRTMLEDVRAVPEIVVRVGQRVDAELRSQ